MGVVYAFSFANSERSMTPMRFDDHRKIVGTGFNTDPRDATEPDGRHAGIPFVVGARRVFSAVAGTDQDVHSYVFMLQVDKHERCSLEVLLAMPDWASISGDGSVQQQSRWRTLTSALDLLTPGADKDQQDMVRFGVVRKFPNAMGEDQGPIWHTIDYAFGKDQHNAYNNECCRMLALHRGNMGPGGVLKWANYTGVKACAHCGGTAHELHCISDQEHLLAMVSFEPESEKLNGRRWKGEPHGEWRPQVAVGGRIQRRIGALHASGKYEPGYMQLFVLDAAEAFAIRARTQRNASARSRWLDRAAATCVRRLDAALRLLNPYVQVR